MQPKSGNITWHASGVSRAERERVRGHRGATLWLTGLSGSGKSTIAARVEQLLLERGCATYSLDGDNIRHGLSRDLGFSPDDRRENIRRTGEVAKLFTDAGVLVLCAFISPYRTDREALRDLMPKGDFVEIYVKASLAACEQRDPKGLYKKARAGGIADMTGISAPYEAPEHPELVVDTEAGDLEQSARAVLGFLEKTGYIGRASPP
jgi:adenylylsulfate kinase